MLTQVYYHIMYKRRYPINRIKHTIVRPVYCSSNKIGRSYNYLESYDVVTSQVVHTRHPNQARQNIFESSGYRYVISTERWIYYKIHKMNFQFWAFLGSQGSKGKFCWSILPLRAVFYVLLGKILFFYFLYITFFARR